MKFIILENIRSSYNVGAIFRTADAVGIDKIFLIGYTPTPIDRFGRPQTKIHKTSLGASEEVAWEHNLETTEVINKLKKEGVYIVAVEQASTSIPLNKFKVPNKVAYILGNEVEGVSEMALKNADAILEIPMLGTKESLNVSVTAGIVMYHGLT